MSGYERQHGKARLQIARLSDHRNHADGANAPERDRDHNADGTFAPGNRAAAGTGPKRQIQHLVPPRGRRIFEHVCRQIGADGGTIAYLHAADAVRNYLASYELGELAREAGLATSAGAELDERATRHAKDGLRAVTAALEAARLLKRPRSRKRPPGPPPGFEGDS